MFGPTYDIETDKLTIHEGTKEELIQNGVKEHHIAETPSRARTHGLNLRYQTLREKAKKDGGDKAVEALNASFAAKGESLIAGETYDSITEKKMQIEDGKVINI